MDAAESYHVRPAGDLPAIVFAPARPDIRPEHRDSIGDFGQQWHQHGALGIVTDFGAAGVGTWDDTKQIAGGVGRAAKSVWHGITSLF